MGNFTYEEGLTKKNHERLEWDNIWWEQCNDTDKNRVFVIGDSISCGYRRIITEITNSEICADGFATSKGIDNPFFIPSVINTIEQEANPCKMILVNNGLHGWHLSTYEYKNYYKSFIETLMEKYPDKKFAIVLTTPERVFETKELSDKNSVVIDRNKVAKEIASELNIDIIDIYTLLENKGEFWVDVVHLNHEGYTYVAEFIVEYIKKNL